MTVYPTAPMASDPHGFRANLQRRDDGIWYAADREPVSYLEDGNDICFQIEEGSFWFRHRNACVRTLVERFVPPGTIYDIGGGNGMVARALIDGGFDTVLVEPGQAGARNARHRAIPTVICATLATAKFETATLPAAGVFDVLEHIENEEGFLGELHRCLSPNGRLYVTVPAFRLLWSDDDVRAGHFRRYTLRSLITSIRRAGFNLLYATYFFTLLPIPLFLLRSLPSLFGRRKLRPQGYGRLHQSRERALTSRVWAHELRQIEHARMMPFGSSCLLAAEKPRVQ
jgi:SAM-dependent methyltransferase